MNAPGTYIIKNSKLNTFLNRILVEMNLFDHDLTLPLTANGVIL